MPSIGKKITLRIFLAPPDIHGFHAETSPMNRSDPDSKYRGRISWDSVPDVTEENPIWVNVSVGNVNVFWITDTWDAPMEETVPWVSTYSIVAGGFPHQRYKIFSTIGHP